MPAVLSHQADLQTPRAGSGSSKPRKSTNLTLSASLVAEAQKLEVNLSQAAEMGIAAAVSRCEPPKAGSLAG